MREFVFAALLAVAGVLVSVGAYRFHPGAGLIVGGVVLAAWSHTALADGKAEGGT